MPDLFPEAAATETPAATGDGAPAAIERGADRVDASKKRLVNCEAVDVNQLMPIKYQWAWEHYLNGCANHWMPTEVPMAEDIEHWKSGELTEDERLVILRNLGFFSTAESLVGNNLVLSVFRHITNPECRQYLLRQSFEEAIHTHAFLYIVESLGLDDGKVFNMYREVEAIAEKDEFEMRLTQAFLGGAIDTSTPEGLQLLLKNLIGFYVIMEGIFFYSGFAMILSFHRQNRMTGIGEQFQYILRDETTHLSFGIDLINGIKAENPEVWTPDFQQEMTSLIREAVELEAAYAEACLPTGVLGLSAPMFRTYARYVADRRLERIGLGRQYGASNPFPWMSETIDLAKEKNFFETQVTEYQSSASLSWDWRFLPCVNRFPALFDMPGDAVSGEAEARMTRAVFPGDTNHYHTLFGGEAMAWMDQAAFICATRWCRTKVVTVHSDEIDFAVPVPEGSIVELIARVAETGRTSLNVRVEMHVEPMDRPERTLACSGIFTLAALDADGKATAVPSTAQTASAQTAGRSLPAS